MNGSGILKTYKKSLFAIEKFVSSLVTYRMEQHRARNGFGKHSSTQHPMPVLASSVVWWPSEGCVGSGSAGRGKKVTLYVLLIIPTF